MKKRIICGISIALCISVLGGILAGTVIVGRIRNSDSFVEFDISRLARACSNVKILDVNGEEIKESLAIGESRQIPLSALHDYTYMAFVAVEDKRFFKHDGLDIRRIGGAMLHNLKSKSFKEGASTISQQLIKNTHLDNSKNMKRKINEMMLALQLENNYSKQEILEMYLNTIYFGRSAYGIENAANVYFDKSAAELTVSESATLAGMIKAPNTYAPDKNAEKCKNRRNTVLKLMLEQNVIDNTQFEEAINSEITYKPYTNRDQVSFVSLVIDEACKILNMTQQQLAASGFVVETYYDKGIQQILTNKAQCDTTATKSGKAADLSCVVCGKDGGIRACYFRGESALLSKQIGSAAKPIAVYAPSLCEKLITEASPVLDEPTDFGGYKPTNVNGYCGWTTVKNAVAKSLNVPAVKTLNTLGLTTAQKYLKKLGFLGEQNLSLALGNINGGMTATQLLNCYNTLRNGGKNSGVAFVRSISSENGEIYSRKQNDVEVFDETSAYIMTDMLKSAATIGTAKALGKLNIDVAAKTGTVGNSNGNSEALVAGYTTEHSFVFWYSGDLPNSVNGGTSPCNLAVDVLGSIYKNKPQKFEVPNGVCELTVDRDSLYNNQLVLLNEDGEKFLFDKTNCPTEKIGKKFDYVLSVVEISNSLLLKVPQVDKEFCWKIFKEINGDVEQIDTLYVGDGCYYAELWDEDKKLYTTPKLQINAPAADKIERWH